MKSCDWNGCGNLDVTRRTTTVFEIVLTPLCKMSIYRKSYTCCCYMNVYKGLIFSQHFIRDNLKL